VIYELNMKYITSTCQVLKLDPMEPLNYLSIET